MMTTTMIMGTLAIAALLFGMLAVKIAYLIWWRPKIIAKKLREQNIEVLPYKLPFGNVEEINKPAQELTIALTHDIGSRVTPLLQQLSTTYKKPFAIYQGPMPTVVIMDPKLIKEMLTKKFEFEKPDIGPTMKYFLRGLATYNGDKWTKHRKIINPAFHMEKLKGMFPSFMASCEEMIQKWDELVGSADSVEVDVLPEFQNLAADVISRAAFSSNFQEGRLIFSLLREQGGLFVHSLVKLNNSVWSSFFPSKIYKGMRQLRQEMQSILQIMVANREKAVLSGKTYHPDLLNLLLQSNFMEVHDNKNGGLSREDVIEECKIFYFAGHETTANLLVWTMVVLSMHQIWQEKARKEVLQLIGKNKPTFDDLNQLKIVNMILLEVLRLYPPTSLVRSICKETKLGEYTLPAGTHFHIPLILVQRDPEIWGEDATEFNPDRFSDGISKACKYQPSFFSFGWGPKVCIGQNFAMIEAKLALALILQNFSFELSPTYKHAPGVFLTLQPLLGAQIILHKI